MSVKLDVQDLNKKFDSVPALTEVSFQIFPGEIVIISGPNGSGKSCIRFKNPDHIPYDLVAELCQKITVDEYISAYETALKRK